MFSILVIEGEGLITRSIKYQMSTEGYQTITFLNAEDAVQFALREMPGLIILDESVPRNDCYQVIQGLREHPKCMHVPIIFVSSNTSIVAKVRAYEAGVDCYLTSPFSSEELLASIRRQLRRIQQTALSPLTRLPGGLQLERAIDYKLRSNEPWSILYLDLDHFKAFNDAYGFLAGNEMILLVSQICQQVVYEYGNADDFVGHIGGDDFVIITTPDREQELSDHILERYKKESLKFYREEDRRRGFISGYDRKGRSYQFPIASLSIGVVSDSVHASSLVNEVCSLTATAKRLAKQSSNNTSHIGLDLQRRLQDRSMFAQSSSYSCNAVTGRSRSQQYTEEDALAEFN